VADNGGVRIAIVSDIHGNRTAFEAVLADLRLTSPDLVFHGGDLADGGSSPLEIVDRIRDLGWAGVLGNTDEMLARPESLTEFAAGLPSLASLFAAVAEMADFTCEALGAERLAWLGSLPRLQTAGDVTLVHGTAATLWRAPGASASDAELESAYAPLARPLAVYGHIHHPFVRRLGAITVANSGSTGLPYDNDSRASYLILDDNEPSVRRLPYDVEREIQAVLASGIPHAEWVARTLRSASPQVL
jgi:putative phosphoesterase